MKLLINHLNATKPLVLMIINSNIVLDLSGEIKTPLFYIFRGSLRKGVFPDEVNIEKVSPIF